MTFLQPSLLWALPLALLPLLIHLLNRMRFRTVRWAATEFLLRANRASTRHARLRQFLILAFRVLALLAFGLMLARPLAGGWMGFAFSGAPDVVILALDRSASMEVQEAGGQKSRRQRALDLFQQASESLAGRSRFLLIDSALLQPKEIPSLPLLAKLPETQATDTAADLPALLDAAGAWIQATKPGRSEIWLASDLQESNWKTTDPRWNSAVSRLEAHPAGVRVRLLGFAPQSEENRALSVTDVRRQGARQEIDVTLSIRRTENVPATIPIGAFIEQRRSEFELPIEASSLILRQQFPINPDSPTPWGRLELPADANLRDNTAFFLSPDASLRRVAVVAEDGVAGRVLSVAAAPLPEEFGRVAETIIEEDLTAVDWSRYLAVIWQKPLPEGGVAEALQSYVKSGGILVFFPHSGTGSAAFEGLAWGAEQTFPEKPHRITQWDRRDGVLADGADGTVLPVADLKISKRREIKGSATALASLEDGSVWLLRRSLGFGSVWFCGSLPDAAWSNLADGPVLVPMMLRWADLGSRRLFRDRSLSPGDEEIAIFSRWVRVEPDSPGDVRVDAGIYRDQDRLVAVNRPELEDIPETILPDQAKELFGALRVHWFEEKSEGGSDLQSEIWRGLLACMLLFLLVESILILPVKAVEGEVRVGG